MKERSREAVHPSLTSLSPVTGQRISAPLVLAVVLLVPLPVLPLHDSGTGLRLLGILLLLRRSSVFLMSIVLLLRIFLLLFR
jgi:hypothetical protein